MKKLSEDKRAIEAAANVLFDKPDGKYDNLKERMDDCRITAKQILQAAEDAAKCKKRVLLSSAMEKETLCPECEEAAEGVKK